MQKFAADDEVGMNATGFGAATVFALVGAGDADVKLHEGAFRLVLAVRDGAADAAIMQSVAAIFVEIFAEVIFVVDGMGFDGSVDAGGDHGGSGLHGGVGVTRNRLGSVGIDGGMSIREDRVDAFGHKRLAGDDVIVDPVGGLGAAWLGGDANTSVVTGGKGRYGLSCFANSFDNFSAEVVKGDAGREHVGHGAFLLFFGL